MARKQEITLIYTVGKRSMIIKGYQKDDILRNSFNELSKETFNLDFTGYYNSGYWKKNYIPYSVLKDGMVVSNVSVNLMPVRVLGKERFYIQLGTVMTKKEYRGQGLLREIMEEIKKDWLSSCDGMFLFANDSVLTFYPKFGFEKAEEYRYEQDVTESQDGDVEELERLDMNRKEDQELLTSLIAKGNPYSSLTAYKNYDLVMFYCMGMLKKHIYYIKDWNLAVIAQRQEDRVILHDVFGEKKVPLEEVVSRIAAEGCKKCEFAFTPEVVDESFCPRKYQEEDCTLFFMENKENLFTNHKLTFPTMLHA